MFGMYFMHVPLKMRILLWEDIRFLLGDHIAFLPKTSKSLLNILVFEKSSIGCRSESLHVLYFP